VCPINRGAGAELRVVGVRGDGVEDVAWSPDGQDIVTASHDRTARIWDADTMSKYYSKGT
jgi:WD40 repeat protein